MWLTILALLNSFFCTFSHYKLDGTPAKHYVFESLLLIQSRTSRPLVPRWPAIKSSLCPAMDLEVHGPAQHIVHSAVNMGATVGYPLKSVASRDLSVNEYHVSSLMAYLHS